MPIVSAPDLQFIPLHLTNHDMEFQNWLIYLTNIICSIYCIDPAELNIPSIGGMGSSREKPLFDNSYESKLRQSKDKGLYPLLDFIAHFINKHIIWQLNPEFVFVFEGLDRRIGMDKLAAIEKEITTYKTINDIRREEEMDDIEFGDIILNPQYITHRAQQTERDAGEVMNELNIKEKELNVRMLEMNLEEMKQSMEGISRISEQDKQELDSLFNELLSGNDEEEVEEEEMEEEEIDKEEMEEDVDEEAGSSEDRLLEDSASRSRE